MTIAKTDARKQYSGDGIVTGFSFPYRFFDDADLDVYILDANDVETLQALTTHYTVSNNGDETGGTVTMVAAPASGETLTILRSIAQTQGTDYAANDAFPAETHEAALDRLTLLMHEQTEIIDRSVRVAASYDGPVAMQPGPNQVMRTDGGSNIILANIPSEGINLVVLDVYDTVALLLASTEASRGVGAIWEGGGFRFPEVTSGEVHTTAGGVKLGIVVDDPHSVNILVFGVVGDGVTDVSVGMQDAIDWGYAYFQTTGIPITILFPAGIYVFRLVYMKPGVSYRNLGGAVFLKTPAGLETDEAVLKWWRMLTVTPSDWDTASECEHRIHLDGLDFDGNQDNMNWTSGTYNQEHAHCLFLNGPDVGASATHRLKVKVSDCTFKDSVADGMSVNTDVDVIIESIEADDCFRGGFVVTGGNSKVKLNGYIGEDARVDFEIDGAGYGGSYSTDFDIDGVIIDRNGGGLWTGGMDFGYSRGGEFRMRNAQIFTPPMNFGGSNDDPRKIIENCYFTVGGGRVATGNRFNPIGNALFRQCDFYAEYTSGETDYTAIHVYPTTRTDVVLEFDKCRFTLDPDVRINEPTADCTTVYLEASYLSGSDDNGNTKYVFRDCESVGDWDVDFTAFLGGTVEVIGGSWAGIGTFHPVSSTGRPAQFTIVGSLDLKSTVTALFDHAAQSTQTNAYIEFQNCSLSRAVENNTDLSTYPIIGHYTFPVTAKPSSFGALRGSVAILDLAQLGESGNPITVKSWVARTSSGSASTFNVNEYNVDKGLTAARPTLDANDFGVSYLDTTLDADGKPIWWNGTAWVDATGATV